MVSNILQRFQRIDQLIRERCTGRPAQLAHTIGVSERTLYDYLKMMKNRGAPICFNATSKSYYYETEGTFVCAFSFAANNDLFPKAESGHFSTQVLSTIEFLERMKSVFNTNDN